MQYTTLNRTDITISRIAFGCMSVVQNPTYAGAEKSQAIATIHAAIDAGITLFDTAPAYGDGQSEEWLGEAISGVSGGGRRDKLVLATKASGSALTATEIRSDCEASLRRLRTDVIDLYQIHWPRRVVGLDETLRAMEDLRAAGKVRALGVCNFGPQDMAEAIELSNIATNQVAYSLLARAPEMSIADLCLAHDVGVLCYSPLAQGLLTGRYSSADEVPAGRARTRHFSASRPSVRHGMPGCEQETFTAIGAIREFSASMGQSMSNVSLAWLLHQPIVTAVLVGGSRPEQVIDNIGAASLQLTQEQLGMLDDMTRAVKECMGESLDMWMSVPRTR